MRPDKLRRWSAKRQAGLLAAALLLCLASVQSFDAAGEPALHASEAAAGLRAARQARADGDLELAAERLEAVAREHPIIADHASALRAEILTESGEPGQAVAVLLGAIAEHPESSLRASMFRALGAARLEFGDEDGARAAWVAALRTHDRSVAPELILALADSHAREGDTAGAHKRFVELWLTFPDSEQGALAAERLAGLEADNADWKRSGEDWQLRADRLFRAHHNAEALASYDTALALGLSRSNARRAAQQRAHTLFRMRRYNDAVEAFGSLPESAEQRLWHARSLARAGQVPESIESFEAIANEGHAGVGVRASFFAGLLLEGRDRHDEARAHFERVASSRHSSGLALDALWRLAWREYQDGRCDAALPRLERLVTLEKDPIGALRPRYWQARCLEALGRPEAAEKYSRIASDYPFTYYGWRASFRSDPIAQDARAADRGLQPGHRRLPTRALARARILISAGYPELAQRELRALKDSARSLGERLELAQLMSDSGDFHSAQRIVVDAHVGDLARGPAARHEEMWWHAWPAAYGEEVAHAIAQPGAAERELVYAIMREESGYQPEVLSVSGAYGLMQIMPTTGERLARDSGRKQFVRDDLLLPGVNVALGAFYLGELGARFPTRQSAAIASYNAGPEAVASWLDGASERLDDEWVESIPYDQTRGYVKKVLRSLHAYRVLY